MSFNYLEQINYVYMINSTFINFLIFNYQKFNIYQIYTLFQCESILFY